MKQLEEELRAKGQQFEAEAEARGRLEQQVAQDRAVIKQLSNQRDSLQLALDECSSKYEHCYSECESR